MNFLDLIDDRPGQLPLYAPGVSARDYGLRWYQEEAKLAAETCLSRCDSALVVKATGLGKSRLLAAIAGDWAQGDVLVLAHRDELIRQNANTLEQVTGEMVEIEQADMRASARCRIVMGSVQSVCRENRLERMGKDRFGLVIVDEAHHATSPIYRKVLDWFDRAKRLGVTATPDRSDEKALGQVFDEVAYLMDISDGIEQGYLVPIRGHSVQITGLDLSGIDSQAGDLVASQLDEAMVRHVEGIAKETIRLFPGRRGPAFFPGVKTAELACQRWNALKPGSACFLHARTPEDERREMIRDIKAGRYQYFANVGIAVEGFDWPEADIVIGGRPTKSRSWYAQTAGRGTRVLPGVVDHIPGKEGAAERRAAVAASGKADCILLDFVGNAGKHSLVGPEDLLGGDYSGAEIALAKKAGKESPGGNTAALLAAARAELQRVAQSLRSDVRSTIATFDPFGAFDIDRRGIERINARFGHNPASQAQRDALRRFGVPDADLENLSRQAAGKLMETFIGRIEKGLASFGQLRALRKWGVQAPATVSRDAASACLDYMAANRGSHDQRRIETILYAQREAGSDG